MISEIEARRAMGHVIDVSRNPAGLLDAVITAEHGSEVQVERDGIPIAKLIPFAATPVSPAKGEDYIRALEDLARRVKALPVIDPAATAEDLYDEDGLPR